MKNLKMLLGFCIALIFTINAHAQSSVTASGGEAASSGGTVSYSVGQTHFNIYTGTNGSISEGVQQPYEISVNGIDNPSVQLSIAAYPNPVTNVLVLKVDLENIDGMLFQLYDVNGRLLKSKEINAPETRLSMANYSSSTYFLKVLSKNQSLKEFKIIKSK